MTRRWSNRLVFAHVLAAPFWALVGAVAGEHLLWMTALLWLGALSMIAGTVLHVRRPDDSRARRVLLVGDTIPIAAGTAALAYVIHDAVRSDSFGALVMDAGAALALFVPVALAPWLLAFAHGRHER